jgi:hypothetical protein
VRWKLEETEFNIGVPEDSRRLTVLDHPDSETDVKIILELLRLDQVVLIQNVNAELADNVMHDIADRLHLSDSLKLQAGFASFAGHRHRIGKYFMSVNKRSDYQFIPPHSEGSSFVGMQLASFFCYENSTDGGETIVLNVDDKADVWHFLRERVKRGRIGSKPIARSEVLRARGLYKVNLPEDVLKDEDQILQECGSDIPGLTLVDVLAKPQDSYSCILDRRLYVYWDTIASIDFDSAREYERLLRLGGLLKEPRGGLELNQMDNAAHRRVWSSGVKYVDIFKCKITRKLLPGDFLIHNNLTWTHSSNNWSPGSGNRQVAASFA